MTINATDVKILKSERLTDFDDGGGKMTGLEVVDGVMNNLFPDISRLDRTYGRVSLRKAFLAIQSDNVDPYYGAHAIITEPPADDAVTVTMFSTGSYADERTNARDRIESYLTPSIESRFVLFGNHLTGSRLLSVYCIPAVPSPEIGEVFALRHLDTTADDDTAVELYVQYQRVQRLISRVNGDYIVGGAAPPRTVNVDVLVLEVSSVFQQDFPGAAPTDTSGSPAKTKINQTTATDAARYYGVSRLVANAAAGDLSLHVANIYAPLVPSAQSEVPVIDQPGAAAILVAAAAAPGALSAPTQAWTGEVDNTSYFPRGFVPGSFTLNGSAFDDGLGHYDDGAVTATLDYPTGKVIARPTVGGVFSLTAIPAAPMSQAGYTGQILVSASSRSYNYVLSLLPLPAPGSLYVDFKAQGRWYRLRDNGAGRLVGDLSSYGSGAIDYTTGSVVITAGALPDVNTSVLYGWGSRENLEVLVGQDQTAALHLSTTSGFRSGSQAGLVPNGSGAVSFSLGANLSPNSVQLSFDAHGSYTDQYGQPVAVVVPVTAYDDGTGNLIRPAREDSTPVGTVDYATGAVTLTTDSSQDITSYAVGPSTIALYPRDYY